MKRKLLGSFVLFSLLLSSILLSGIVTSDPADIDKLDGTRTATWDFGDPNDYSIMNTTMDSGKTNLSMYTSYWNQETFADLDTGLVKDRVEISGNGNMTLTFNSGIELLKNRDFSDPALGAAANNWTAETSGNSTTNAPLRSTGAGEGIDDDFCWRNWFVDATPADWYNLSTWVNQSFYLPTLPLDVNVSAFYDMTINVGAIAPGTIYGLLIYQNSTNITYMAASTGWENTTFGDYRPMWSNDVNIFNETGLYNISLFTLSDSSADISNTPQIYNYWDNISIEYSAYELEGSFQSSTFDVGSYAKWGNISWDEELPSGTDIEFRVRTGNSSVPTDSIWSDWSDPMTDPTGCVIDRPNSRYVQYMVNFTTMTTNITPILNSINISYDRFFLQGIVETEDLAPADVTNWGYFTYSHDTNGQSITYEYSVDSGAIWDPIPADGDMRFLTPQASSTIRFRAILSTADTVTTPSIDWMELEYVANEPIIEVEGRWDTPEVEPGEVIRLYIFLNNTASSVSSNAWLNIYLDPHLTYVSDNVDSLSTYHGTEWDNSTGVYRYHIADIPQGSYSFWIETRSSIGAANGTVTSTIISLEYQDPLDNRVDSYLKEVTNVLISPVISIDLINYPGSADVGDIVQYIMIINNTGGGNSPISWLNVTPDNRLDIFDPGTGTINSQSISWELEDMIGYSSQTLYLNASLKDNVLQGSHIPLTFTINYSDISGFMRSTGSDISSLICELSSSMDIGMISDTDHIRPGDTFIATMYYNNSRYGTATYVQIDVELPEGLELYSSSSPYTSLGNEHTWTFTNVMPGSHSYTMTILARSIPERITKTNMTARMSVMDPIEGLQESIRPAPLAITIESYISNMEMEIIAPSSPIHPGDIIVLTVYYNNTGDGAASIVSFSLNIPYGIELQSSSAPCDSSGDLCNWNFTNVLPGPHSYTISLEATDISEENIEISYNIRMSVTDPIYGEMPVVISDDITTDIERIVTIWEKIYWPWSGLLLFILLSIITIILWNKYKPIPPSIDDAFLIYKDGRLISHKKSVHGLRAELDGDIVSAMLTAVQQFVNDSLDETGTDKMRKLEFGDRELFMERGENIYMAIMFSGTLTKKLDDQITEMIKQIEVEFPELAVWNGRMKGLEKIDDYLNELIDEWQHHAENLEGAPSDDPSN